MTVKLYAQMIQIKKKKRDLHFFLVKFVGNNHVSIILKNIVSVFRHHRPKKENENVTFIFMTDTRLIISNSTFLFLMIFHLNYNNSSNVTLYKFEIVQ